MSSLLVLQLTPPTTALFPSRATTPILAACVLGHQEASKLILIVPLIDFSHRWFVGVGCMVWAYNDLLRSWMVRMISSTVCEALGINPSNSALHLAFNMCQAVIMVVSHLGQFAGPIPSRPRRCSSRHVAMSVTSPPSGLAPSIVFHSPPVQLHPTVMCSRVSCSPHTGHPGFTDIPLRMRFALTTTAFVAKRHT